MVGGAGGEARARGRLGLLMMEVGRQRAGEPPSPPPPLPPLRAVPVPVPSG